MVTSPAVTPRRASISGRWTVLGIILLGLLVFAGLKIGARAVMHPSTTQTAH